MSSGSGDVRHMSDSRHSGLEQHSLSAQSINPSVRLRTRDPKKREREGEEREGRCVYEFRTFSTAAVSERQLHLQVGKTRGGYITPENICPVYAGK